jgi:hypothetical protein
MLRYEVGCLFALSTAAAVTACVDPKKGYDDYLARTADADTVFVPTDDAPFTFDASSGADAGFTNQSYVMACVSQIDQDSVAQTNYLSATATFTPSDDQGNGTFDFTDTSLTLGPNGTPPTSTTATAAAPYHVPNSTVTGGKVDVVFGPNTIPAAAEPLGTDVVFTDTTLHVLIGPGDALCATISGDVTAPLTISLTASENICVFTPLANGATGPIAALTQSQVHCP